MTRFFITLLATGMALSTVAQSTTTPSIFKKRPTPAALENFHQLYTQSLQQARTAQPHDSLTFAMWDNGQWTNLQYSKISRDPQNRIVEVLNYDPSVSLTQPISKFEMTYTRGKLYRQSLQTPVAGGWQQEMALEYRYDIQGNQTATTFSIWDLNGSLQLFYGDSLEYSYLNQEIVGISYGFGFAINGVVTWEPVMLMDQIDYDPSGRPISFTQAEYDNTNGTWLAPVKLSNLEWGFGFVQWSDLFWAIMPLNQGLEPNIPSTLRLVDPTSYLMTDDQGTPLTRATHNFQAGLITNIKYEGYNSNGRWIPEFEQRFSYNVQNKVTNIVFSTYDTAAARFVPAQRSSYNYLQAYYTGTTYEIYSNNIWTMISGIEYLYAFDVDNRVTEIVTRLYDELSASWINNDRISYHYPSLSASVGRLAIDEVKVFPNPTQGQIDIHMMSNKTIDRVVVRNMQGQELYSADFGIETTSEHKLDLGNLPAGMYFVQIQSGRETGVARVVKR